MQKAAMKQVHTYPSPPSLPPALSLPPARPGTRSFWVEPEGSPGQSGQDAGSAGRAQRIDITLPEEKFGCLLLYLGAGRQELTWLKFLFLVLSQGG